MLEIEIDGKSLQVGEGSTVMDAARVVGAYIPHFCYHKKLSIAANCRMCLVEVEKAPKPLPACATPVTNGMKVHTHSPAAVKAQKGVMEFLLINHPLDCPICDQGGECQLQDLAVGYGSGASRYQEEKRVVSNKDLGPLISTDMTRCIHCTRCVRFGQEIAGVMELGVANRGERSEILAFVGRTVDSELSGNVIDLCPVGALTSKPFRFSARTWELARRRSISPHDGLGSNLVVQVKHHKVMRVLPLENEGVNECWLSDRDRFSYEALNSGERLERPMIKQDGRWHEVDWSVALDYVAHALKDITTSHGADALGALASPHGTLEELYLLQKLVRGLGSNNIDFRLRQTDFSLDGKRRGAPWLGVRVSEIGGLDRALVVGSFLRKDHPLIAQRLRGATRKGLQLSLIHASADDLLMPVRHRATVAPGSFVSVLAQVVVAAAEIKGVAIESALQPQIAAVSIGDEARRIAESLASGGKPAVFLGNLAQNHPQAAMLHVLAQELARIVAGSFGFLGEAANSVGGYLAAAFPANPGEGLNALAMVQQPRKAYLVLHADPRLDCADPPAVRAALGAAESVVVMSAFKPDNLDYADCLLPISPFTETAGTFVSTEGRIQHFNGVVKPHADSRPAWKVFRVLGSMLNVPGFDFETIQAVRDELLADDAGPFSALTDNGVEGVSIDLSQGPKGLQRVPEVPPYAGDPIVRRAPSLQKTRDAAHPAAAMNASQALSLGLAAGDTVVVRQGDGAATLGVAIDESVSSGCVKVAAASGATADLGPMFGIVTVERA
jgi:NADH-quinone oxidoreductase subunit G